jgi:Family of unknown function (DUF5985)
MSADFVSGGAMVAALVIGLFFIRYWRQTRDRLFLGFAAGFFAFSLSRLILAFLEENDEGELWVYTFRLLAFALILAAIIDKNRSAVAPVRAGSQNGDRPGGGVEQHQPVSGP